MSGSRSPESWSELSSLIDTLLDAPLEQRSSLIDELSGGDRERRAELERLVAECEDEPRLLSRQATESFASLIDATAPRFPESLSERYRLTREVGRGGMATVYLARDLKHGRDVAVKVVHPELALAGGDRFLREIEIVAQLRHPNIVPLYDSGDADGSLYYVMPYEGGSSLRHRLTAQRPLPVDEAVLILRDVCDALAYAHQRGIVHRDIKPDNVLLSGRHAMVADFGVARAIAAAGSDDDQRAGPGETPSSSVRLTWAGAALGTPPYMAPEQVLGGVDIDHRVDIYAVGALGYELLTGRTPFARETRESMFAAHLTETPDPPTVHRPDIPAPLADLIMRCLAKQAADRWQSAEEIVRRLERLDASDGETTRPEPPASLWRRASVRVAALVLVTGAAIGFAWLQRQDVATPWRDLWASARVERLTDFPGSEVDAAISGDGRFVAFLADRDSVFDAFVTEVEKGGFRNLTNGRLPELLNQDVRNIGFSADSEHVWVRVADITSPASVALLPVTGGLPQPFLPTAVMAAWSPDGSRLAYHETTPGDPIYIADRDGKGARRIFVGSPGVHNHHLSWSPNGTYLYYAHGLPPDEMDVWRIPANGGTPERITTHNSRVAYPVALDDRTVLYTATADDGTGPWLYSVDVDGGIPERASMTVEHYLSIAASADVPGQPRRFVATVSNPSATLWSVPITPGLVAESLATRLTLPTARSVAPRFTGQGSLLYLAARGGADGLWRLDGTQADELWKADAGGVVGAAAVSPDGKRTCVPVRYRARTTLHCLFADQPGVRTLADSLDVRGAGSFSPDGNWLVVAAKEGNGTRIFKVPVGGGVPIKLVDSVSSSPVWSPDGRFIVYAGTPRARSVPLKAVTPDGQPFPFPTISVDRVGDSYRFLPDGKQLVVKLGGFRRQDFWLLDIQADERRRLTSLRPGESLHRFDVSPNGDRIVFERVRENSDIALIELPRR